MEKILADLISHSGAIGWILLGIIYGARESWKARKFLGTRSDIEKLEADLSEKLDRIEGRVQVLSEDVAMIKGRMAEHFPFVVR